MSNMLARLQSGSLEKEFPKVAAGDHTFAIGAFSLVKSKTSKGVPAELIQVELITLASTAHKPGSKLNKPFYIGFPDQFEGQSDQEVSRALTFVKKVLGLETVEECQKRMGDIFASMQNTSDANIKSSFALFGLRVDCKGTGGVGKKSGKAFVDHEWSHVEGQTPEVIKAQSDELATFLGVSIAAPAPAVGGSLLGGLNK